jgi:hypothetical protein
VNLGSICQQAQGGCCGCPRRMGERKMPNELKWPASDHLGESQMGFGKTMQMRAAR